MILDYLQTDYKENLSEKDNCFFREVMKIAYIVDLMESLDCQKHKKIPLHLEKKRVSAIHASLLPIFLSENFLI